MHDLKYEKQCLDNYKIIGGIDEAGRGPLAGPVVAACVLIDKKFKIQNSELYSVGDSKRLSPKKRDKLFEIINSEFFRIGVGICDSQTVDRINVLQATFLAMKKAIGALKEKPEFIIVDGNSKLPNISIKQASIIKGDSKIFVVAVASIVAKVSRDRIMMKYHKLYPQYEFDQHKGYGTKLHMERLAKYGPCKIHRLSYAPVKRCLE